MGPWLPPGAAGGAGAIATGPGGRAGASGLPPQPCSPAFCQEKPLHHRAVLDPLHLLGQVCWASSISGVLAEFGGHPSCAKHATVDTEEIVTKGPGTFGSQIPLISGVKAQICSRRTAAFCPDFVLSASRP